MTLVMRAMTIGVFLLAGLLTATSPRGGAATRIKDGMPSGSGGAHGDFPARIFHQYEAFAAYGLPWSVRNDSGWGIAMQLNMTLGALHAADDTGFIGGIGPGIIFDKAGGKGVALDLGGDLNGLSQYQFGKVNLNGHVLWDGHVGITYRFDAGPGIGYRFQHMSNGGLNGNINTGLDLHMLALSWNLP